MSSRISISQCEDDAFISGTCVEVSVHHCAGASYYLVGSELEYGETMIAPLKNRRIAQRWMMPKYTVLDAIELLQTAGWCHDCDGTGVVEEVGHDLADVREERCLECDGKGWR